jgi:hypothetical protein
MFDIRCSIARPDPESSKRHVVKLGQRNGLVAQIVEGVSVVNHPGDDVEDGVRVTERL